MQDGQYDFNRIEKKWQDYWLSRKTFRTPDGSDPAAADKPKYYVLDMFPYPSGAARRPSGRVHGQRYHRPLQANVRL